MNINRRGFLRVAAGGLAVLSAGRLPAAPARNYRWKRTVTDKCMVLAEISEELMSDPAVLKSYLDHTLERELQFCLGERFERIDRIDRLPDRWNIHASFLDDRAQMRATWRVTGVEREGWQNPKPFQPNVRRRELRRAKGRAKKQGAANGQVQS